MLDVWPALPLVILCHGNYRTGGVDSIIAGLERIDRVRLINLADVWSSDLEILLEAMQQPFPELTRLLLHSRGIAGEVVPVVPDSFLGGSAPRLRHLHLDCIPFPGLPNLLLSATFLVDVALHNIPHSGYFPPDTMVTALSSLTSLESLLLQFQSPRSFPDPEAEHPPPSTRSALSVLTYFAFKGDCEYLEDLVARIDVPRLNNLKITFFNDITFDTPQLMQFISRTPMLGTLQRAYITLPGGDAASVKFSPQTSGDGGLNMKILCRGLEWQVSSLEQVCSSCLPPLSMLEDLYIYEDPHSQLDWKDNIENGLWLGLLHPFTVVENLYLSERIAQNIGPALQELVGGRSMEVFPTLQNVFLKGLQPSGPVQEGIGQFISSRQAIGRPIAVSRWGDSYSKQDNLYLGQDDSDQEDWERKRSDSKEDNSGQDDSDQDDSEQDNSEQDNSEEDSLEEDNLEEDNLEEDNLEEDNLEEDNLEEDNLEEDNLEEDNLEEDNLEEDNSEEDSPEEDNSEEDNSEEDNSEEDNSEEDNSEEDNSEEDNLEEDNSERDDLEQHDLEQHDLEEDNLEEDDSERDDLEQHDFEQHNSEQDDFDSEQDDFYSEQDDFYSEQDDFYSE